MAIDTSRSALMSRSRTIARIAPYTIGVPQSATAVHAGSMGRSVAKLNTNVAAETATAVTAVKILIPRIGILEYKKINFIGSIVQSPSSSYFREILYGLAEIGDRPVRVAVFDAFADAMVKMAYEHDLAYFMERRFGGVYLCQYVFARYVLVHHAVDGLDLADDFLQPSVQIVGIHAGPHVASSVADTTAYGRPVINGSTGTIFGYIIQQ